MDGALTMVLTASDVRVGSSRWRRSKKFVLLSLLFCFVILPFTVLIGAVRTDNQNFAPFPSGWEYQSGPPYGTSSGWAIGYNTNLFLDTNVLFNGQPSCRYENKVSQLSGECDGPMIEVHSGDHIVFSMWMKTGLSSFGDTSPESGIRIGIDFYGAKGDGSGTSSSDGSPVYVPSIGQWSRSASTCFVQWNTPIWTKITIDFTVPKYYEATPNEGSNPAYHEGEIFTAIGFVPWVQVLGSHGDNDQGMAWFSGAEFYINPSGYVSLSHSIWIMLLAVALVVVLVLVTLVLNSRRISPIKTRKKKQLAKFEKDFRLHYARY
jgi:hypothetical protein